MNKDVLIKYWEIEMSNLECPYYSVGFFDIICKHKKRKNNKKGCKYILCPLKHNTWRT